MESDGWALMPALDAAAGNPVLLNCNGSRVAEPALDFAMERLDEQTPTVGVGGERVPVAGASIATGDGPPPTLDAPAKRCVQCGEVIDAVILRNRRHGMSDAPASSEPVKHGSGLSPTKERS